MKKKLFTLRIFQITTIILLIYNSFVPTKSIVKANNNETPLSINSQYHFPVYSHPEPRKVKKPVDTPEFLSEQSNALTIVCVANCSNTDPGTVVSQTKDSLNGSNTFYFKFICSGWGCTKKDVYFHATVKVDWATHYPRTGYSFIKGGTFYGVGTGNISPSCGNGTHGECFIETYGVIPHEIISPDPGAGYQGYHFYVNGGGFGGDFGVQEAYSYTHTVINVEVSTDSNLLFSKADTFCAVRCDPASQARGFIADPIDTNTGGFTYPINGLSFMTSAGDVKFIYTYISQATNLYSTPMGIGWTHNQDIRLIFSNQFGGNPGFVLFKHPSGNLYKFFDSGQGRYQPYSGVLSKLQKNTGSPVTYTITDHEQNKYLFDAGGKIINYTDIAGKVISYLYDVNGNLSKITVDNATRYLDFEYYSSGRLYSVSDHQGRSLSFIYNIAGDLESVYDVQVSGVRTSGTGERKK
jgi:hypothetical protein